MTIEKMNVRRFFGVFVMVVVAMVSSGCASDPPSPGEYWQVTNRFTYGEHKSAAAVMKVCYPANVSPLERLKFAYGQMKKGNKEQDSANGCEPAIVKTVGNRTDWKLDCFASDRNGMVGMDMKMHGTMIGTDKEFTMTTYRDMQIGSAFYSGQKGFGGGGQVAEWKFLGGDCDTKKDKPQRIRVDR